MAMPRANIPAKMIPMAVSSLMVPARDTKLMPTATSLRRRVLPEDANRVQDIGELGVQTGRFNDNVGRYASVIGQAELDDLLAHRDKINRTLQEIIDRQTDPWGIKVSTVELKHIDLPQEMQRAIAKQAEAERERRAKIIHADGELQASDKLAQAAKMLASEPTSLHLRYLQTLTEIAREKNSTILFPIPIDLIKPFLDRKKEE